MKDQDRKPSLFPSEEEGYGPDLAGYFDDSFEGYPIDNDIPLLRESARSLANWVEKDLSSPPLPSEPAPMSKAISLITSHQGTLPEMITPQLREAKVKATEAQSWKGRLEAQGILFIPHDYLNIDLYRCLRYLGFELLYSKTRTCFLIKNPHIEGWKDWLEIRPDKEGIEPLARAKTLITRICAHFVSAGPKMVKVAAVKPGAWGKGSDLYGNLISLKGDTIKSVNEYERWVDERFEFIDSLNSEQQTRLVASLDSIVDDMPGIAPLTEDDAMIARHAFRYLYVMMAHRIIQDHPDYEPNGGGKYEREIRPQREVPILAGEPDLGKSTILEMLLPKITLFRKAKMKFSGDANLMGRACSGNILMIANEMSKIRTNSAAVEVIKGFIPEPTITFDEKYERNKTISMPSVFASTANEIKLPHDKALRSRFVIFRLGIDPSLPSDHFLASCSETRGKAIAEYIAENRWHWLNAGLFLARKNASIQCPKQWMLIRERIARATGDDHESDLTDVLEGMIESDRWHSVTLSGKRGKPAITGAELAWQAGLLRWQRPVKDNFGATLYPINSMIETDHDNFITHADLTASYDAARKADHTLLDRVRGAFVGVGWGNKKEGGGKSVCHKRYPTCSGEIKLVKCYIPVLN